MRSARPGDVVVHDALRERAAVHQALGEPHRLAIVDALWSSDRTPSELQALTGLPSNLLAFHLDVLEDVGLVERHTSYGDRRRRYVSLRTPVAVEPVLAPQDLDGPVLFVCSRNSARSQLAAALWAQRTGRVAASAGSEPAARVHPLAVEVAAAHALDLSTAVPRGYGDVEIHPTVVVSVCDRAREAAPPFAAPLLHWSIPDPVEGDRRSFEAAFAHIGARVDRLAPLVAA